MSPQTPTDFRSLVELIVDFINILIPAVFALVFIYFMWKVIDSWVIHAGEDNSRAEGRQYLLAAVIAFVVMVSAWGIVAMLRASIFG